MSSIPESRRKTSRVVLRMSTATARILARLSRRAAPGTMSHYVAMLVLADEKRQQRRMAREGAHLDVPGGPLVPTEPILRRCGCGLAYTATAWARLDYVGLTPDGDAEMRNCRCGSTIAIEVRR